MKLFIVWLVFSSVIFGCGVCLADQQGATLKKFIPNPVDDAVSGVKTSIHESIQDTIVIVKSAIKSVLGALLEIITILAIGWGFSFLVDKRTAKMIMLLVLICGVTQVLRLLITWVNTVTGG